MLGLFLNFLRHFFTLFCTFSPRIYHFYIFSRDTPLFSLSNRKYFFFFRKFSIELDRLSNLKLLSESISNRRLKKLFRVKIEWNFCVVINSKRKKKKKYIIRTYFNILVYLFMTMVATKQIKSITHVGFSCRYFVVVLDDGADLNSNSFEIEQQCWFYHTFGIHSRRMH